MFGLEEDMLRRVIEFIPLLIIFALGLLLGRYIYSKSEEDNLSEISKLVQEYYVDPIGLDSIHQKMIPLLLSELDPHSAYLTAEINRQESEVLEGSFHGIGIQFNRLKDTIIVTRIIEGGGAERAGLKAGDRILKADTASLLGRELTNEYVMSHLKGPEGSVVRLGILRQGEPLEASVVRGVVPITSVDASYMVADSLLYVRLNKWAATTHQEFLAAFVTQEHPVKGIVLDLRDNGGGYLESAFALAGEFLPRDTEVLYAEGRKFPRQSYRTTRAGLLNDMPLVVLINEFSASASEIFAGAMQDYDRATIIGRRTFGKGLVQRPFMLKDSSVVRLTVARYYTPSGRSIQKSYARGYIDYAKDLEERNQHGEFYSADSIAVSADTTTYRTRAGRVVRGGGGITPDLFVPRDSTGINSYFVRLAQSGTMPRFAFEYADKHREKLSALPSYQARYDYLKSLGRSFLFDYAYYAQAKGIPIRTSLLNQSAERILEVLYASIVEETSPAMGGTFFVLNQRDLAVTKALRLLQTGVWQPMRLGELVEELKEMSPEVAQDSSWMAEPNFESVE